MGSQPTSASCWSIEATRWATTIYSVPRRDSATRRPSLAARSNWSIRSAVHRTVDIYELRSSRFAKSSGTRQECVLAQLPADSDSTWAAGHNATDYRSRRSLFLDQRCQQGGFVLGRHHEKQATRSLRVHAEIPVSEGQLGCPLHPVSCGEVPLSAPGDHSAGGKISRVRKYGYAVEGDLGRHLARLQDVGQVSQQTEPGHVGGGADANPECGSGGAIVQRGHRANCLSHSGLEESVSLEGCCQDPGSQRLGEHQPVTGAGAGVGEHPVRVDLSHNGHTERRLDRVDRMTAEDQAPGFPGNLGRSFEHFPQDL